MVIVGRSPVVYGTCCPVVGIYQEGRFELSPFHGFLRFSPSCRKITFENKLRHSVEAQARGGGGGQKSGERQCKRGLFSWPVHLRSSIASLLKCSYNCTMFPGRSHLFSSEKEVHRSWAQAIYARGFSGLAKSTGARLFHDSSSLRRSSSVVVLYRTQYAVHGSRAFSLSSAT
ncbi:uncharacterized protein B0I36DRAFT_150851 [Microdochium trichocladiopsis]|uniref:Uncharacterized protein n=1 Tax=Microdochium trichocladiopsis TaxID=1682393 RepID=A0A9P8XZB6_9PEZI|nr:uncharacterized protein B0I36DRAFT_150851 [Microdochium trichocladiopsis]KAH7025907.1 hypothetical protein B0I36DRAFT_150851 [Microdochium trichocladiopsis]